MYYRLRIPPFCWPLYPPPQALHSSSILLSFPSSLSPTSLPLRHIPFFLSPTSMIAGASGPQKFLVQQHLPSPKAAPKVLSTGSYNGVLQSSCDKSRKEGHEDEYGTFLWPRIWSTSPLLLTRNFCTGDTAGWALTENPRLFLATSVHVCRCLSPACDLPAHFLCLSVPLI